MPNCDIVRQYGREPWFRHICALGGALNIVLMMSANLVGFVLGTEGTRYFVEQIVGTWRGPYPPFTCYGSEAIELLVMCAQAGDLSYLLYHVYTSLFK